MPESPEPPAAGPQVRLKDPLVAGVWLGSCPGWTLYQGRYAKAALLFVSILGTFLYGLYLGSDKRPAGGGWSTSLRTTGYRRLCAKLHDDKGEACVLLFACGLTPLRN